MDNLIVMYHYVRDDKRFKAMSLKQFSRQLGYLKSCCRIISLTQLLKDKPAAKTCILTFDDGLKDGFIHALPILKQFQVPAVFFIPTRILVKHQVLASHKLHLLLARLGTKSVVKEFNCLADKGLQITDRFPKNPLDDLLTSNLKHIINHGPADQVQPILNQLFKRYFSEAAEFKKLYLTKAEIIKMQQAGMEIGLHGHEHLWLGQLPLKAMEQDLTSAVRTFKQKLNFPPQFISYPFGSFKPATLNLVRGLGLKAGITTIKQINRNLKSPFSLGRFDCVDLWPIAPDRHS